MICGCEKVKRLCVVCILIFFVFIDDYYYSFLFLLIFYRVEVELL